MASRIARVPAPGPILRAAARTHPGRVRPTNEDLPLIDTARGLFGVIDGIGGHAGGEVAAAMAKDVAVQRLSRPFGSPAERVREAIAIANNTIYRRASDCPELTGMACVITLAIAADGRLTIGHVGDTRLYKLRGDGIRKLTRDHSPVGEREDAGELSEADAMRHPHRNEVFRDVGTTVRDKDEQDFVDVIEEPLEADAAILLCSDGLSDMLPAATIAHIVRQHAGDPEQVVDALVAAANDAGGRDNITVVFAEMPLFAERATRGFDQRSTPTEPPNALGGSVGSEGWTTIPVGASGQGALGNSAVAGGVAATGGDASARARGTATGSAPAAAAAARSAARDAARGSWFGRAARAIVSSRLTWFTVGALAGVFGAIGLTSYVATLQSRAPQTLVVAATPGAMSRFTRIGEAIAAARPGDVVRVEPGQYREQILLRDGIDLVARVPGTVTIVPPADAGPALSIVGGLNVRVAGIRIEAESPIDTAIAISAPAATLEMVEISGPVRAAFALSPASAVTVRGSHIAVTNTLLSVPDDGHATFVDSVLTRTAAAAVGAAAPAPAASAGAGAGASAGANAGDAALSIGPSAHVVLRGNVFAGFGARVLDGIPPPQRAELLAGNIVVPVEERPVGAGQPAPGGAASPAGARRRGGSRQTPENGR